MECLAALHYFSHKMTTSSYSLTSRIIDLFCKTMVVGQILYINACLRNRIMALKWPTLQGRNRDADAETNLWTQGGQWVIGIALAHIHSHV